MRINATRLPPRSMLSRISVPCKQSDALTGAKVDVNNAVQCRVGRGGPPDDRVCREFTACAPLPTLQFRAFIRWRIHAILLKSKRREHDARTAVHPTPLEQAEFWLTIARFFHGND